MNRILIAEDEPRLASFLEKGLRANGFVTTVVADGPNAALMARDNEFDLLVLDLGLPGKDGPMVLRKLRSAACARACVTSGRSSRRSCARAQ